MKCRRCKKHKDLSEFHRDASRANGRVNLCKTCTKKDAQHYYKVQKLKAYNLALQRETFPDFGRRAIRGRIELALESTPSIFQEV